MASRNMDAKNNSDVNQNPPNAEGGHGCITMIYIINVVTRAKDYGSLKSNLGIEPTPPKVPLHIDKPEFITRIPRG